MYITIINNLSNSHLTKPPTILNNLQLNSDKLNQVLIQRSSDSSILLPIASGEWHHQDDKSNSLVQIKVSDTLIEDLDVFVGIYHSHPDFSEHPVQAPDGKPPFTGKALLDIGIVPGSDITPVCCYLLTPRK